MKPHPRSDALQQVSLDVYWNTQKSGTQLALPFLTPKVGVLQQMPYEGLMFQYDETYIRQQGRAISFNLPLQSEPYMGQAVEAFFAGLLPDDKELKTIAKGLGLSDKNTFGLLYDLGRDCAGALSLVPEDDTPLLPREVTDTLEYLKKLQEYPLLPQETGVRLSMAGAQRKLALRYEEDTQTFSLGIPSTHIVKPSIPGFHFSVLNEYFCMQLAKQCGLKTPSTYLVSVEGEPYYVVTRYDRKWFNPQTCIRLHQEDFCQALGCLPYRKYQREGGPSLAECFNLLTQATSNPLKDKKDFRLRVIFNYLIGNYDAHGKNFSLLYDERGIKRRLAPVYDVLSTAIYPQLSSKMAMKIGSKYHPQEVQWHHWCTLYGDNPSAKRLAQREITAFTRLVCSASEKLSTTLPHPFRHQSETTDFLKALHQLIITNAQRLLGRISTF
jgi:serine/threonine-protein kinase HipA